MKRRRSRAEDQDVADQPLSEPDLQESAAEVGEEEAEQPTQQASIEDQKRLKLQKRLDKLKNTYDGKGSKSKPEHFPLSTTNRHFGFFTLTSSVPLRCHLRQQDTTSPGETPLSQNAMRQLC